MKKLKTLLESIDHKGYPAYKGLKGSYKFNNFILNIDHVQGDPFASPSRLSIDVKGSVAGFPENYYDIRYKKTVLEDFILRNVNRESAKYSFKAKGSGKSGLISVSHPGQEILERSACSIDKKTGDVKVRLSVGFPANGRSINARELIKVLFDYLPGIVEKACLYINADKTKLRQAIELADDREFILESMKREGYVAFVANGAVLPRESGVSQKPMKDAVKFISPESMEVTWTLPHRGKCSGMAVSRGITLIVGGGYHGKSTLLQTLERTVYPHIQGDGREYVVTDPDAVKIRAEDGRSICHTDISPFIRNLPNGRNTEDFSTLDASGSTSQAANVVEAVEAGTDVLLIDEDTSATNFMIRDELMESVVSAGKEPIIPFIRRVRDLYEHNGVSTILVAGSCGEFFKVADRVIQMDCYLPYDITDKAKKAAKAYGDSGVWMISDGQNKETDFNINTATRKLRIPAQAIDRRSGKPQTSSKIKVMGTDGFAINKTNVDLRYIEQITDGEQMLAIAKAVDYVIGHYGRSETSVGAIVDEIMSILEDKGVEGLVGRTQVPDMAMPRKFEIYGCINRFIQMR